MVKKDSEMKKTTALLLCFVMLAAMLAGCTQSSNDLTTVTTIPTTAPVETPPTESADPWAAYDCITVAEALKLCEGFVDAPSMERYYIRVTVDSVGNPTYGQMTVSDPTGTIEVYGSASADGSLRYDAMEDKPYAGDEVLLYGTLQNYKGTKPEIQNGWIVDFRHAEAQIDPAHYKEMTVAEARKAPTGTKVQVTGVVARITYANGMIPSGIIMVDGTSSIYVYDGDLAARCAVGNTVSIGASKTYWILDTEQGNAAKFGYLGCNQLEEAVLISNDGGSADFDRSWIETTTVKDILDTPVTEDISTKLYKVNAQIVKAPGNGFTNYYINDLDGKTGSYAYSQCNGDDFSWLDAFDGKICTVYVMALNAKSTSSDCFWRFLPVAVVDEGFNVSTVNVAEHSVKYYGIPQFLSTYSGDPALELIGSVDSQLLGFTGATLSYASSNASVISIGGNVMHCLASGTAEITVTGSFEGKTFSDIVTVTVTMAETGTEYPTVSDAIAAAVGDKITVKGIVGPSLVNKTGFYLIDDTGVIAVETTADILATLEIGYEVALRANRGFNTKSNSQYGQICLKDAAVLVNNYGSHTYSTASFAGEITVADFYNLDINTNYTTNVYTMKATVLMEESAYYTNIYLTDGTTNVRLYCSNASQYNWLKVYAGQEITVEIAPCNWNSKNYYTGCVLSVLNSDGSKTVNNLNFE